MTSSVAATELGADETGMAENARCSLLWMVVIALVLRLGVMCFLYPEQTDPYRDHWRFGGEAGRIARSIVQGEGFSSPFFAKTGPTALMTPVYIYLMAGVFKLFGIYSTYSALVLLSLNSLFSALTCLPVFFIARRNFGDRVAFRAGWAWALFPFAIYFAADFVWPTVLTTLLLSLLFLMALHLESSSRLWLWVGFGVLYGAAALTEPIVLSVLPCLGGWACYRLHKRRLHWFLPGTVAALAFFAVVSPWFVRNYEVFHKPIFFRDNFGLELYIGNSGCTWHWAAPGVHPSASESEWKEYEQLGELAYMRRKQQQALEYISGHRDEFVLLSARRWVYFWTSFWSFERRYLIEEPFDPANIFFSAGVTLLASAGLWRALRRGLPATVPFALVFLFFPVTYTLTHMQDYYRRPIDPLMVVLAVYAVSRTSRVSHNESPAEP